MTFKEYAKKYWPGLVKGDEEGHMASVHALRIAHHFWDGALEHATRPLYVDRLAAAKKRVFEEGKREHLCTDFHADVDGISKRSPIFHDYIERVQASDFNPLEARVLAAGSRAQKNVNFGLAYSAHAKKYPTYAVQSYCAEHHKVRSDRKDTFVNLPKSMVTNPRWKLDKWPLGGKPADLNWFCAELEGMHTGFPRKNFKRVPTPLSKVFPIAALEPLPVFDNIDLQLDVQVKKGFDRVRWQSIYHNRFIVSANPRNSQIV